jgi:hypothetical protein
MSNYRGRAPDAPLDAPLHAPLHAHDSVSALVSRLADLTAAERHAGTECYRDRLLDDMEVVTLGIAGTRSLTIEECRDKVNTLRARLVDMLDMGVPAEAVTLALVASVALDVARLAG